MWGYKGRHVRKRSPSSFRLTLSRQVLATLASLGLLGLTLAWLSAGTVVEQWQLAAITVAAAIAIVGLLWWGFGSKQIAGTVGALLAALEVLLVVLQPFTPPARPEDFPVCKGASTRNAAFVGVTLTGGVWLHSRPDPEEMSRAVRLPGDCKAGFKGFCFSVPIIDPANGMRDARWFIASTNPPKYVASAVIKGNPDNNLAPMHCAGDRSPPAPGSIRLSAQSHPDRMGKLKLAVQSSHGLSVGFILGRQIGSTVRWKRIGLITDPANGLSTTWDIRKEPSGSVTLAAVECIAALIPSQAVDARPYQVGGGGPGSAAHAVTPEARAAACRLPDNIR